MYKSKLISLLKTLTGNELKWFDAYVRSPFFNKNETVVKLLDVLKKYHPAFPDNKVTFEAILPLVLEKEKFDEQKLRYVMTDLTRLLEGYIGWIEFEKNDVYRKHLLLNAYNDRNLDKYFHSTIDEARIEQKEQPFRDVNFFFNQHLLEENAYLHSLSRRPRSISSSLQEAVDNLDYYYLSNRLRYSCAILNRQDLLHEEYNNLFLEQILSFLGTINLEDVPSVSIYHSIALMYIDGDNLDHYYRLRKLLNEHSSKFPDDEVKDMYTQVINYCIRIINKGKLDFMDELFTLYKEMVVKGIIYDNGFISPSTFKNIVTTALRTGQPSWAEDFIEHFREKIDPEYRESTYAYNLANLYYSKRDFSRALKLMQTAEMNDIYYHLDAKTLLLRTYYELDETEPFFSLVDAFTNYLKRNKLISDSQRTIYLNFVRFARKLMNMKLGGRHSPDELRKEMEIAGGFANLQWLQEKLDQIEKTRSH